MPFTVHFRRAIEALDHISDPMPPWEQILATARDLIGADTGSLIMMDGRGKLLHLNHVDVPKSTLHDYIHHFHKLDVIADAAVGLDAGAWLDSNDVIPASRFERTEFHADYLRKHRQAQILALVLEQNIERRTAFSFQRSTIVANARDKLTQGEVGTYIRTFQVALERRRQVMANNLQLLEDTFSSLGEATCLVSVSGTVVHASAVANALLDNRNGLCIRQGRLFHPTPAVQAHLARNLEETLRTGTRTKATVALAWGETLSLDIAPSSPQVRLSNEPLAFMRLRRNSAFTEANVTDLVCIFGVTAAEARVLAGLVAGLTPAESAVANDVSENTVRKQIANLKTKMHCSRVVDLVKLAVLALS